MNRAHVPWHFIIALCLVAACERQAPLNPATEDQSLSVLLGSDVSSGFPRATEPRQFEFPRDHGPHPEFRNEWWYLTGNLDSTTGRRFGYELTIFRFALQPQAPAPDSAWRTQQLYIGHFAVSDIDDEKFYVAERFARGAAGLSGARGEPPRIWLYDWNLRQRNAAGQTSNWQLQVADEQVAIELLLEPKKPHVLQGDDGLSRKSAEPGNASYYYSMPRLRTTGIVRIADEEFEVSGLSWMDREWSSSALSAEQQGWDWFALQLDDGNDLMFYQLRRRDGSIDNFSAGSLSRPDGSVRKLSGDDVQIDVLDYWDSPLGGRYPHGWRVRVSDELIDLRVRPAMAAQELDTWVRYWEGAVDVSGSHGAKPIAGRGYVELTGYATEQSAAAP